MPECYADTLLIETLVPPKHRYNHQRSCLKVEREMVKGRMRDRFAVGIIDKDKKQINYLNEFDKIDTVEDALILYRHRDESKHYYIIQIMPAMEKWVLKICEEENILLGDLSTELRVFTKFTKKQSSMENPVLKALFLEISTRENNLKVRKLKGWLNMLKEKNYQVDLNELKNVGN